MKKREIYNKSIETWGERAQVGKMVEEILELALVLHKAVTIHESPEVEEIQDEIVDASIMLEQVRQIFFVIREEFYALKWKKLRKVARLLEANPTLFYVSDHQEGGL